jgi:hypothetical protein
MAKNKNALMVNKIGQDGFRARACVVGACLLLFLYFRHTSHISYRQYDCGKHSCKELCHPHSPGDDKCPRSPSKVKTCACGKRSLKDLEVVRMVCTDPLPCCDSTCDKPRAECDHSCSAPCESNNQIGPLLLTPQVLGRSFWDLSTLPGRNLHPLPVRGHCTAYTVLEVLLKARGNSVQQSLPIFAKLWQTCLQSTMLSTRAHQSNQRQRSPECRLSLDGEPGAARVRHYLQ